MNKSELVSNLDEDSRIKVVGLGGIGCIVLQYLTVFLKSLDRPLRLVLIDGDRFEVANNRRMIFQTVGNKAEVKAAEIVAWLGPCELSVVAVPQYLTVESIEKLILPGDHVFLCVDNHPTRKLVSDHCARLSSVALFSGGNEGVDPPRERGTYGNVQVYLRRDDRDVTASLTRFHPEIATPKGKLPSEASCVELAASTPQILFTNLAVASAMLNAFFAHTCGRLAYQEVKLDVLDARMLPQM
ncbi:MAG TPA: ThiF family adenylyltransferase [Gemmataceae bacterium]|jgi:molybdopterin/thiamine biosynthesis adenylyltransferase